MNAPTFDHHSPICPICHRSGAIKPHRFLTGLLTCEYCRGRLVVSWSGHYVRDPFSLKPLVTGRMLRRASSPLARFWRDFVLTGHPVILATFGSLILLGVALASLPTTSVFRLLPPQSFPSPKVLPRLEEPM